MDALVLLVVLDALICSGSGRGGGVGGGGRSDCDGGGGERSCGGETSTCRSLNPCKVCICRFNASFLDKEPSHREQRNIFTLYRQEHE